MRRSGTAHRFAFRPIRSAADRLELFQLPPLRIRTTGLQHPRPIWRRRRSLILGPLATVLVLALALGIAAIVNAAPPLNHGARPIALGQGYTAVSGDVYALYYNPAGLFDINQKEVALDYGHDYSPDVSAGTDFNATMAVPWKYQDRYVPLAAGVFTAYPARNAHMVDLTAGAATDLPAERLTNGIIRFPVRAGLAATLRQQAGSDVTDRVGKTSLSLGLTGGLQTPIGRQHQVGIAIRNLFAGDANPNGPSLVFGATRHHRDYLDMFADLEYGTRGIWSFHPGLEWLLARGVFRPRLGWGYRESHGIDMLATGVGLYLSPMQIDISYIIPLKTVNDNAGQIRASFIYRFGRRAFSEVYYDRALEQASELDKNVLTLTVQEAELKSSVSELEQKRRLQADDLAAIKKRIEALKDQDLLGQRDATIRDLKERVAHLEAILAGERSATRVREKKPDVRTHTVAPGDTLQSIARTYYGDPNQWKKIYSANTDKVERGLPKIGARLVIP